MTDFTMDNIGEDNIALRGKKLVRISVTNDKGEELSLKDIFDKLNTYIKDNSDKIEDSIALVASFGTGPFYETQRPFVLGYLYCKYISKLEEHEKTKYNIEFTEREISKEEARKFIADALEKSSEAAREFSKKLRNGDMNIDDLHLGMH